MNNVSYEHLNYNKINLLTDNSMTVIEHNETEDNAQIEDMPTIAREREETS